MTTNLSEPQLVTIRAEGLSRRSRFVDPAVVRACTKVLHRRGEVWAAAVLGRDISARSSFFRDKPALRDGEEYILVLADEAEDDLLLRAYEAIDRPEWRDDEEGNQE
jgi:hypothetical protein